MFINDAIQITMCAVGITKFDLYKFILHQNTMVIYLKNIYHFCIKYKINEYLVLSGNEIWY